jgi:NhaP-type Na+/H+ or K+/H+ antiporter
LLLIFFFFFFFFFFFCDEESGLNDGTGYPFVMLCLRFVARGNESAGRVISDWIIHDILWEILLAIVIAIAVGYIVGMIPLTSLPHPIRPRFVF